MENVDTEDAKICIWKPHIKKTIDGQTQVLKFPCRYPDKPKTHDICTPCLMGDMFAMQYTQMQGMKKQQDLNEEVMTFLRNMTSDGDIDSFK